VEELNMTGRYVHRYLSLLSWSLLVIGSQSFLGRRTPFHSRKINISFQGNRHIMAFSSKQSANDLFAPTQQNIKKKKKNKYAEFSKVEKVEQDPFEALVQESEEKLKELEDEKNKPKNYVKPSPVASKPLEFPNNKDIDPYDPTSFGYIEIGTILNPHGVHGWTKVQGCTDFPERLTRAGMLLHMKPVRKRAPRKVTLASGKLIGLDSFLIQLQGVYNRTEAQKLKGATLYYATQEDTVVADDDFLVSDLVGLEVFLDDDTLVGTVDGIVLAEEMCAIPGLGHDMLEVRIASNGNKPGVPKDLVLIPLVPEIVPKIDLSEKIIVVDPPTGLLDLTYIREEKVRIKGFLPPAKD
jgi:16S rRNA processing protein RimM